MAEDKKVIGIAQVLQHLKDGMTRDDIAAEYGITKGECKILFQHEDLKGKKTIKKPSFVIVADATAEIAVKAQEVVADDASAPDTVVDSDSKEEAKDTDDAPEAKEEAVGPGPDAVKDDFGTTATDNVDEDDADKAIAGEDEVETPPAGAKATWD